MTTTPIVIAHRGASGYLPEHTLAAKALAYGLGADYLEQDVVATRDSRLVVLHDLYLDDVTDVARRFPGRHRRDGRHYVIDFDLAETRAIACFRAPQSRQWDREVSSAVSRGRRLAPHSDTCRRAASYPGVEQVDGSHGGHLRGDQGTRMAPPAGHRSRTAVAGGTHRVRLFPDHRSRLRSALRCGRASASENGAAPT